jgi:hypothetical protein
MHTGGNNRAYGALTFPIRIYQHSGVPLSGQIIHTGCPEFLIISPVCHEADSLVGMEVSLSSSHCLHCTARIIREKIPRPGRGWYIYCAEMVGFAQGGQKIWEETLQVLKALEASTECRPQRDHSPAVIAEIHV